MIDKIETEYRRIERDTVEAWRANPTPGEDARSGYDIRLLGFSSGSRFSTFTVLSEFMAELEVLTKHVRALDLLPDTNLHFTFLALSPHVYESREAFPEDVRDLKQIAGASLTRAPIQLSRLRLVPLPNALVLAGIPDCGAIEARAKFAEVLLNSRWEKHLRSRYGRHPIPPLIWHTTLVREGHQYLSPEVRELFYRWRDRDFGNLELSPPVLAAVTYNWSRVVEMS